jgi:lysophospholipase L1-like esterase
MKRSILLKNLFLCLICCSFQLQTFGQSAKPFWNEIQEFKKKDSISMPPKHGIVFLGSSSIRMWNNAEKTFSNYQVINRGFGGSTLVDAAMYVEDLVYPYDARQIVVYSGENDIASGAGAQEVFNRFKVLATKIRSKYPKVPLLFISMKESPSRVQFRDSLLKANDLIKAYMATSPNAKYVDVNVKMLDKEGHTRPELFREDMLHMKEAGYIIWENTLRPYLLKPKNRSVN